MKASIIIPVFNSKLFLPILFEHLELNKFEPGDEVLLVDNGSTDGSLAICEQKANEKPDLYRCLSYTDKAGSYAARNFGVRNSRGDILVFTDSDTKPTLNWLTTIKENIKVGTVIAGRIQLEIINNGIWELYDNLAHLNSEKNANNNFIATANMAVCKSDFCMVGFFEERFSGGDYEWSSRAKDNGLTIKFVEDALVYHPTRKTFAQILKKEQRIAYGAGNHYKIKNKSYFGLIIRYSLKILKIDTLIRHHNSLKRMGASLSDLHEFDKGFMKIRFEQLKFAIRGYKFIDARKLQIK